MAIEQAITSAEVLVEDEVLAHQADGFDRLLLELAGAADRHPVAAQQFAHRRSRADLGDKPVLFRTEHFLPRWHLVGLAGILLENRRPATANYWLSPFVYRMLHLPWGIANDTLHWSGKPRWWRASFQFWPVRWWLRSVAARAPPPSAPLSTTSPGATSTPAKGRRSTPS